jgi:hypothetical protein
MKLLAFLLLLASPTTLELLDETPTLARAEWRFYRVSLTQNPATVQAAFEVQPGSPPLRLSLMTHDEMERRHAGGSYDELATTPVGERGTLIYRVPRRDEYVIVVDNSENREKAATVRVQVALDFAEPKATRVSPERQITVIVLSFAFFFTVVTYSARRILRAIRN